jgi:CRISPR-associated endonuclease/helicase Cas3
MLRLDRGLPARLGLPDPQAGIVAGLVATLMGDDEEHPPLERSIDRGAGPAATLTGDAEGSPLAQRLGRFGTAFAEALPPDPAPGSGWPADAWAGLRRWAGSGRLRLVEVPDLSAALLDGREPPVWVRLLAGPLPPEDARGAVEGTAEPERDDEEVTASSIGAAPVTLAAHHAAVRERAGQIAEALGLPGELCDVVRDAAGWHDLGKAEPRFQIMLHRGDACEAALAVAPLAKSGLDPADRLAWRRAGRGSGLPPGARHEAWSAALVAEHLRQRTGGYGGDADLLVHLVASHHGYARPLARLVVDPAPRPVEALVDGEKVTVSSDRTVCLDQPARFARLNDRYGRWGLALLETVVRCADMTVSEEGS